MPKSEEEKIWYLKIVFKVLFALLFILASMLVLAGRLDYWQGWVFGGICVFLVLIQSVFFKDKTGLAKERLKPGPGTKWWDKILLTSFALLYLVIIVIAPLDAGRFEWSGQLPLYVYIISYPAFFLSVSIFEWAILINRWFSSVVRIQKDRDQRVVQTGPYRIVRHPGYTGGILIGIFTSLILGSLWALIPGGIAVILLIVRTYLEDITLQKELSGYADYARKVRYRLLPGIW